MWHSFLLRGLSDGLQGTKGNERAPILPQTRKARFRHPVNGGIQAQTDHE
jgi:hypothetical protein